MLTKESISILAAKSSVYKHFALRVSEPKEKTDTIRVFDIQNGKATKRYDLATKFDRFWYSARTRDESMVVDSKPC